MESTELTGSNPYTAYADTRYNYDVAGNLLEVRASAPSDPAPTTLLRVTTMEYDKLGRKTKIIDQDMGQWEYDYDSAGNLTRQEHVSGPTDSQATCFYYDNFSRLIRRVNDATTADDCPAYANTPASGTHHLASYSYGTDSGAANNLGKPLTVSWGTSPAANNDAFTYDGEGRPAKQTRLVNGRSFAYEVTAYDTLDRPTQVKLYDDTVAETIDYSYDHEGAQTLTAGGTQLIDNVGYNERGQLAFLGRPGTSFDTSLVYHDSTLNFRLNKILHGGEGGALPDFIYGTGSYDAVGNLTGMQMKRNTGTDNYAFFYDEMNRLTTSTLDSFDAPADFIYTYAYDELGNLKSRAGTDPDMTYAYGAGSAGPQAVTSVSQNVGGNLTYAYDPSGNLATRKSGSTTTHIYTFDVENRLTSVQTGNETMSFAYDGDGQRVLTTRHGGTLVYTPFPDYEREVASGGAVTTRTTYRIAGQIVAVRSAGTLYYTYTDHLGNVAALSSYTGVLDAASLARYDPFGNYRTTPTTNPGTTNHGFTGHRHNNTGPYPTQNVGLIYMNARYYHPQLGRFVSPDSIVPDPANPQSHNRYAYVRNSPISYTDPSGHRECADSASCANPLAHEIETPLVLFTGGKWLNSEEVRVGYGAYRVGAMLYRESGFAYETPRKAFLAVYGGAVTFHKTGLSAPNLGAATGRNRVLVNDVDGGGITSAGAGAMWAAHEMGHALNYALRPNGVDDLNYGAGLVSLALEGIFVDGKRIAGNTTRSYADDRTYVRTALGYKSSGNGKPYQQNASQSASEDFADMFMNYVFGSFADDANGAARSNFMDSHMSAWISLATSTSP